MTGLDVGLHLLGGDPLGFWKQPRDVQVDLLAYRQMMLDREQHHRWGSMGPARTNDLGHLVASLKLGQILGGLKAWLGAKGVRFRESPKTGVARSLDQTMQRALHLKNMKRCNASKASVSFWLGS